MLLKECRTCSHHISTSGDVVICSFTTNMTEQDIESTGSEKIVLNCPLEKGKDYEKKLAFGKPFICGNCDENGEIKFQSESITCPLCHGAKEITNYIDDRQEETIPHISEFRIQAIQIEDKYKVVMTTERNNKLVTMSKLVDLDDPLYNEIYKLCFEKIEE